MPVNVSMKIRKTKDFNDKISWTFMNSTARGGYLDETAKNDQQLLSFDKSSHRDRRRAAACQRRLRSTGTGASLIVASR